jgi:Raf kinase inhibitor-like YbhB/YbcL family protein
MKLESAAFEAGKRIPDRYTCKAEDVSPPLTISGVPKECKSLPLIMDDPDAPAGTFDHWILWNLNPSKIELAEAESFSHEGENGFGTEGYRGPCPPIGKEHRYFFKLFALDTLLDLPKRSIKEDVETAMDGHILSSCELIGTFQRD